MSNLKIILSIEAILISFVFMKDENSTFCKTLNCTGVEGQSVCGIRPEMEGFRLRVFENECALYDFGCRAGDNETYGLTNSAYCDEAFDSKEISTYIQVLSQEDKDGEINNKQNNRKFNICNPNFNCDNKQNGTEVCAIRSDGDDFRIRLFSNKCEMLKHNCEHLEQSFTESDLFICDDLELKDPEADKKEASNNTKNRSSMDVQNDINEIISISFADLNKLPLPVRTMENNSEHNFRRSVPVRNAGPSVIYKPLYIVPKTKLNDSLHLPTLNTCYHKCPQECPDTYAPICGESSYGFPAIVFKNHCLMDMAQCRWFNKAKYEGSALPTYSEKYFVHCLGDKLHGLYRFLPVVRSLQHMGRMKKKGNSFHYKVRDMRFWNNYIDRNPKFMG